LCGYVLDLAAKGGLLSELQDGVCLDLGDQLQGKRAEDEGESDENHFSHLFL
jgi:hypothetical protein